jgi:hypothetical protein
MNTCVLIASRRENVPIVAGAMKWKKERTRKWEHEWYLTSNKKRATTSAFTHTGER